MSERSVMHSRDVIERSYPHTPQRVFAAFSDPAKKDRWFAEDDCSTVEDFTMDFGLGRNQRVGSRPPNGVLYRNDTIYQEIVPDLCIVIAYTMSVNDRHISSLQATTELLATGKGTSRIFTEQAAFLEGADGPQIRQDVVAAAF
jgi:uncharacterized protein YndB with AHSA1/START domain